MNLHSQDNVRPSSRAAATSGSTSRSRSAAASCCRSARPTTSRATASAARRPTGACSPSTAATKSGDFYSGTRTERSANLTLRARPGLIVYINGEWNSIKLAEGQLHDAALPRRRRDAVHAVHRAGQQHPVRHAERGARAGSPGSAGSSRPATTSTSSTRTTGWTSRCSTASPRSTSASRPSFCTPIGSEAGGTRPCPTDDPQEADPRARLYAAPNEPSALSRAQRSSRARSSR